ncbi:protein translocase subunit secA [Bradyrhizobium lablabi]|uniref:Protein translocase subunit SecA n=2 Tax=Bradyrhizobium lablabi TaxID=722472 RepID=A0A1M7AC00_9BRAD|nr:protein translocase subunit secA [Bradyrhizobium lablabi]
MFEAMRPSRRLWSGEESITPYPERNQPEPSKIDRFIAETSAALIFRFRRKGGSGLARMADAVDALAAQFAGLDDAALRATAATLRAELTRHGFRPDIVARTFALVRETSARLLGLRHHRSQIMGGWAMLNGGLAEMETGEGKTITALLPAVTAALASHSVHIITVNEYLAERDSEQTRPIYEALGLTVGVVRREQPNADRKAAYDCDVTFCTNSDLVFDYLRDRMALGRYRARPRLLVNELLLGQRRAAGSSLLLRGLHFVIIDEADSVLIDEARTPLILSAGDDEPDAPLYYRALALARLLQRNVDFKIDETRHSVHLTLQGRKQLSHLVAREGGSAENFLWQSRRACDELLEQALTALHLFRLDKHYIVAEGKVQIVDEYTGRVMPDRSWERGLHQMIEAKEGCEISGQRMTQARITYQRFFRRYLKLSGMSGTIGEAAGELWAVYGLKVIRIPTHRPLRRRNLGTRLFANNADKWRTVVERARHMRSIGRPVLVGTRSVAASEQVSRALAEAGRIEHEVLNARQDKQEADIVAAAGQPGRITVATNMAGRGTDIKLTADVVEAGGLHVIITEFHESARIDRQLFGRCARQGNPGTFEAIVSLEDELFHRFVGSQLWAIARTLVQATRSEFVSRLVGGLLRLIAQRNAERTHAKTRRETVEQDKRLDQSLAFAGKSE